MKVELISHTNNPLETLYTAYRVCYSAKPVTEIREEIKSGKITQEDIKKFLKRMFKTGHTSPLRQLHFVFVIEGVSRALTAQFNRHTIGVDRCEMSQRYIKIKSGESYPCIYPDLKQYGENPDYPDDNPYAVFKELIEAAYEDYDSLVEYYEVPKEDARYGLPMGTESREQVSVSFEALQHFLDVRLCEMAQWEIRELAWKIYKLMRKQFPLLASTLGVKCWKNRAGYCNEMQDKYKNCRWCGARPHKSDLMRLWERRER